MSPAAPASKQDVILATASTSKGWTTAAFVLIVFYALVVLRRSWLSDDAFITLRTVDNLVNGYGLTWNVGERVQTYTHPLWMMALALPYAVTREPVYTTILLSWAVAVLGVVIFSLRVARSPLAAALGVLILTLSRAYADFSTSGLEDPLSHLLLISTFAVFFGMAPSRRKVFTLSLLAALAGVNRLDTLLLVAPILLLALIELRRTAGIGALLLGQAPLLLWLAFATFYYGFPFPNTAYAKLNTGIPTAELVSQGMVYLANSLERDPLTPLAIAAGLLLALFSRDRAQWAVAVGILLYLAYIVAIGGDFMSGRLLTMPLLAAVALIARFDLAGQPAYAQAAAFGVVLIVGLSGPFPTPINDHPALMTPAEQEYLASIDASAGGVIDERLWYYSATALLAGNRLTELPNHELRRLGLALRAQAPAVTQTPAVGMVGYYAGPHVHIVDPNALGDPLLARLPAARSIDWRPGHFTRVIPPGYLESQELNANLINEQPLRQFYESLRLITRGPLWDGARLREIWRMNTGRYDGLIDSDAFRYPDLVRKSLLEVGTFRSPGSQWDAADTIRFTDSGVRVDLGFVSHAPSIQIALHSDSQRYELIYLLNGREVARQTAAETYLASPSLFVHHLQVPAEARRDGFDTVHVLPTRGDSFGMGYLRLWGEEQWPGCGDGSCAFSFADPSIVWLLDAGWSNPEPWGVWSLGPESIQRLYLPAGRTYLVEVEAFPFQASDGCWQSLSLSWNGQDLGEQEFIGCDPQTLTFAAPASAITEGMNTLRWGYGRTHAPAETDASADQRQLAVGFLNLTVHE